MDGRLLWTSWLNIHCTRTAFLGLWLEVPSVRALVVQDGMASASGVGAIGGGWAVAHHYPASWTRHRTSLWTHSSIPRAGIMREAERPLLNLGPDMFQVLAFHILGYFHVCNRILEMRVVSKQKLHLFLLHPIPTIPLKSFVIFFTWNKISWCEIFHCGILWKWLKVFQIWNF